MCVVYTTNQQKNAAVNGRLLSRERDVVPLFTVVRIVPPHTSTPASARNVVLNLESGSPIQSFFHVETIHLISGTFLTPTAVVDVATMRAFLRIDVLRAVVACQPDIVAGKVQL